MAVEDLSLRPERAAEGLRVSAYDRSSSLLIALLMIVSAAVLGIVIVFFSNRISRTPPAIPVTPIAPPDTASGAEEDFSDTMLGVEDAELEEVEVESFLETLSEVAASDSTLIADKAAAEAPSARKGDPRGVGGSGSGRSNSRDPRWELRFEPESSDDYARWCDEAGFAVGVLGTDNVVYYATKLSTPKPEVLTVAPQDAPQLYFNSVGGPLHPLDRRLAQKAGILDKGNTVLLLCLPRSQQSLLGLQLEAADGKPVTDIALVVFRVTKTAGRFDLNVEDIQFHR